MIVRRLCAVGLSVFFGWSAISVSCGQQPAVGTFDFDSAREPVAKLDGLWRFHAGDDPRWAEPGFDDSGWPAIRGDKSWIEQGYKGLSGYAWYRARVVLPPGTKPLSLYVPRTLTNFQVFVDGRRLEGCNGGRMDKWSQVRPVVCDLPNQATGLPNMVTLAIRVWHWPYIASYTDGGMQSPVLIGERKFLDARHSADVYATSWRQAGRIVVATLTVLSSVAGFLLFLFRRDQREYLWFGILAGLDAVEWMMPIHGAFYSFAGIQYDIASKVLERIDWIATLVFFFYLLRGRRDWLFRLSIAALLGSLLLVPLEFKEWISISQLNAMRVLTDLPTVLWIWVLVKRRAVEGDVDGRLVLGPVLLAYTWQLVSATLGVLFTSGVYRGRPIWVYWSATWPFRFNANDVFEILFLVAMLVILIYRFNRSTAQEERMAGELSAANAVQHILIPEAVPELPGFAIESVYRPANEVGGDFFQILPTTNGGVLAVIGDVSGKGVPAAMIVSLLVGTLRTLAESTDNPAELLDGLNRRLIGRSSGFTTCLILRADPDGTCVVANAGHVPLYVDGREMEVETGLPLGISADAGYEERAMDLPEGARLTLLTDGVVEARSRTGELYGFDRTAAVAKAPAAQIAAEAQAFGQEDDITVVSVTRAASLHMMRV